MSQHHPSIGKRWPPSAPPGDYKAKCAYCGQTYRRSQLKKDGAGRLACSKDFGPDEVTLDKANIQAAAKPVRPIGAPQDGTFTPSGTYTAIPSPSNGMDAQGLPVTPTPGGYP